MNHGPSIKDITTLLGLFTKTAALATKFGHNKHTRTYNSAKVQYPLSKLLLKKPMNAGPETTQLR
jgi:hypothetical protein